MFKYFLFQIFWRNHPLCKTRDNQQYQVAPHLQAVTSYIFSMIMHIMVESIRQRLAPYVSNSRGSSICAKASPTVIALHRFSFVEGIKLGAYGLLGVWYFTYALTRFCLSAIDKLSPLFLVYEVMFYRNSWFKFNCCTPSFNYSLFWRRRYPFLFM